MSFLMDVGLVEHARKEIKSLIARVDSSKTAFAFYRLSDVSPLNGRDNRMDANAMLRGLVHNLGAKVTHVEYTGRELHDLDIDFPIAGAAFNAKFMLVVA